MLSFGYIVRFLAASQPSPRQTETETYHILETQSDRVGRRPGMIFGSLWMALFALLSGLAYGKSAAVMIRCLIAYRFLIGIAIGAEYPAGSVAAAENTEDSGVKKSQQNLLFGEIRPLSILYSDLNGRSSSGY